MAEERLQKILSRAGIASRRAAERLILEGRVQVNGVVVRELGTKADPSTDLIQVDDQVVAEPESFVYYMLYKPPSMVTTLDDPEGRPSVGDLLRKAKLRVFPVGRLDYDAEGALILTNDGDLAHKLTHPRWGCKRTYEVKVKGEPTEGVLERLRQGVRLEDGFALPEEVSFIRLAQKNTWIRLVLTEGRHHLVKRLCDAVGHPVVRLFRSDYSGVGVEGMRPGELRELSKREVQQLRAAVAQQAPLPPGGLPRRRRGGGGAVSNPIYGQRRSGPGPGRGPAGGRGPRQPGGRWGDEARGPGGLRRGGPGRQGSRGEEAGAFRRGEGPGPRAWPEGGRERRPGGAGPERPRFGEPERRDRAWGEECSRPQSRGRGWTEGGREERPRGPGAQRPRFGEPERRDRAWGEEGSRPQSRGRGWAEGGREERPRGPGPQRPRFGEQDRPRGPGAQLPRFDERERPRGGGDRRSERPRAWGGEGGDGAPGPASGERVGRPWFEDHGGRGPSQRQRPGGAAGGPRSGQQRGRGSQERGRQGPRGPGRNRREAGSRRPPRGRGR